MTEEQINELIKTIENYKMADKITAIIIGIFFLIMIAEVIYNIWKIKKIKKWREEYKATLTKEQLKALEDYKKITL